MRLAINSSIVIICSSKRYKRIRLLLLKMLKRDEFEKYFFMSFLKSCNTRSIFLKKLNPR